MYIILFLLILSGLVFHEIFSPIADFFIRYQMVIICLFLVIFIIYAFYHGYTNKSIGKGIGVFLAFSQFWFFVLVALLSIADIIHTESDTFLSAIIAIFVGALSYAYAGFNYKMILNANEEGKGHPMYHIIVGIVGWIINAIILF